MDVRIFFSVARFNRTATIRCCVLTQDFASATSSKSNKGRYSKVALSSCLAAGRGPIAAMLARKRCARQSSQFPSTSAAHRYRFPEKLSTKGNKETSTSSEDQD